MVALGRRRRCLSFGVAALVCRSQWFVLQAKGWIRCGSKSWLPQVRCGAIRLETWSSLDALISFAAGSFALAACAFHFGCWCWMLVLAAGASC